MRNAFLSILFLFPAATVNSQVEWNVFAGPQITSSRYLVQTPNVTFIKQKSSIKYGFQLGMGLKIPFEAKLFFAPQGFYSLKGYKVTFANPSLPPDSFATDNNTTLHTAELAPLLQYDFSTDGDHFFLRVGPSLDFQLFGKEQFNRSPGEHVSRNMKFSFGDYGHFAANFLVHFGYESGNGFQVYAQYSHGIASINNKDGGPRIYHRAAGISVGYFFNRQKMVMDTRNKE